MKNTRRTPAYFLFYIVIGLMVSGVFYLLVNLLLDRPQAQWLSFASEDWYDKVFLATILIAPTLGVIWGGLTHRPLWVLPLSGIAGGTAGFLLLGALFLLSVWLIILLIAIIGAGVGSRPDIEIRDSHGNTIANINIER